MRALSRVSSTSVVRSIGTSCFHARTTSARRCTVAAPTSIRYFFSSPPRSSSTSHIISSASSLCATTTTTIAAASNSTQQQQQQQLSTSTTSHTLNHTTTPTPPPPPPQQQAAVEVSQPEVVVNLRDIANNTNTTNNNNNGGSSKKQQMMLCDQSTPPRRTKIVVTVGPATSSDDQLRALVRAGMDCARINFHFYTGEEAKELAKRIRAASKEVGKPIAILGDLVGSRMRVKRVHADLKLKAGDLVALSTDCAVSSSTQLCISRPLTGCRHGQVVLLNDHQIELRLGEVRPEGETWARVVKGGTLPRHRLRVTLLHEKAEGLTESDLLDMRGAVEAQLDFITLSFVETAAEVRSFKEMIAARGSTMEVVSKLETRAGLNNIADIAHESHGVLLARGDLALDLSIEEIAIAQKTIIASCHALARPTITATQVLESMTATQKPTRAEATDVANAILDGSDAVMLTSETAVGLYPLDAVMTLGTIAAKADDSMDLSRRLAFTANKNPNVVQAFAEAACDLAANTDAKVIVVFTTAGIAPRLVSRMRPSAHIVAIAFEESVVNKLALAWGVTPVLAERIDRSWKTALLKAVESGCAKVGDKVVVLDVLSETDRRSRSSLSVHSVPPPTPSTG